MDHCCVSDFIREEGYTWASSPGEGTHAGDLLTETSLSAHHIFSKQPFSTKKPPKAISLSSILNIAEDKTEHAVMAEWWYRRAFHCEFFICSGWAWERDGYGENINCMRKRSHAGISKTELYLHVYMQMTLKVVSVWKNFTALNFYPSIIFISWTYTLMSK